MFQSVINRASLGRGAQIGALYDVRTESFLHDSLFGSRIADDAIDSMDLGDTSIELVMSDSVQEKFNKLDVEAELQVSLLAGLIKLSGSGAYLSEQRKSARAQSMSLLYKMRTVNEEFMIRQNRDKVDLDVLTPGGGGTLNATHVVVGIDWGAVCSVTCEYENKDDEDETTVKGALGIELEKLKGLIDAKGSARVEYGDNSKDKATKFTFRCKTDVSARDKELPITFEGAVELARSLPTLVQGTNSGKGVPLTYMLMPLDAVVKMCKLQITLQIRYATINEDTIRKTTQVVERITKKRQRLYDIQNDLHTYSEFVADGTLDRIDQILDTFSVEESSFKARLQELVKKARSGLEEVSALESFLADELNGQFPLSKYEDQMRGFQKDVNKVKLIRSWKDRGIIYMGKRDQLKFDDAKQVHVFYKTDHLADKAEVDKNEEFFLRLQRTHSDDNENYQFVVVDVEIRPDFKPGEGKIPSIHKYVNGRSICKDLFDKEGRETELCLIRHETPTICYTRPSNRAIVTLRCPNALSGTGQCSGNPITWKCSKCKEVVEYGITTKLFYCMCGQSDPMKSLFRCNEKWHGMDFIRYPATTLVGELSSIRAEEEKNILILGETGVGKSTWINGFANYLSFADINEAKDSDEFYVLIPSKFTFTTSGQSKEIIIGNTNDNEILSAGHSATQGPQSYVFHAGGQKIRLIDTPGIGDSRGIEKDRENFDNILSYLSYYDEIHAVCILLKPNNSRLTAMFRFCIQELLARLHTSAKDNIVFCFTNARATFYQPGDTLPSLQKMLREKQVGIDATPHNYFCFDNEPFRFLACIKNGVQFSDDDVTTYATSWNKAVSETNRLFGCINKMKAHKVKNTLSMNEARRVIVAMSKPMAEVAKTIEENMQAANEAKKQIDLHQSGISDLEKSLKFSGIDLVREQLSYPRTVCAHSDCTEIVPVGKSHIQTTNYKQICHHHCNLSGIPTETTNDSRLQSCWAISGTTCHQCNHHFTYHMHLTYNIEKVPREFISDEVQKQIRSKATVKEKKEAYKRGIDSKVNELKVEEKTILRVSAQYGSFLKENAIIPYNDAVGDYLDMAIQQEENRDAVIRNNNLLKRLKELRCQYEKEKEILEKAIRDNTGGVVTTPEQVMELQKELFGLKHFGKTLENIFVGISIGRSSNSTHFRETSAPVRQNYKQKSWLEEKWTNFRKFMSK